VSAFKEEAAAGHGQSAPAGAGLPRSSRFPSRGRSQEPSLNATHLYDGGQHRGKVLQLSQPQPKYADRDWRRAAVQTTFERNVLPDFAGWFAAQVEAEQPDIVMPVETKGARLVDATLAFLDRELATPSRVPVRYKRSLDYTSIEELAGKKVLVLDDATRTGRTLNGYRLRIRDCCPDADAVLLACFGALSDDGSLKNRVHQDIRCFRDCLPETYHEELWQLTELVVARGLPPEVDHHIFRLRSTLPIARFWSTVVDALGRYGQIDDHGVTSADGLLHGATLHWPDFAPAALLPLAGPIRREGVVKLRLFGDAIRDEIIVVPMAYVEVELPRGPKRQPRVSLDEVRGIYDEWRGDHADVGAVLFDATYEYARLGEVLFNAACLTIETELLGGAIGVLAEAGVIADRQAQADEEHFYRLYGAAAAPLVIEVVTGLAAAHEDPVAARGRASTVSWDEDPRIYDAANGIVRTLKQRYIATNAHRAETSWRSYSLPFSQLDDLLPEVDSEGILASRSVDFGLGVGSLVPSTTRILSGHSILLRRQYRTSEQTRVDGDEVLDLQWGSKEIATEIVGAIAHFLKEHSVRWRNRGVPPTVMNKVIAVLKGAMPEIERTALVVDPREHGPEAFLRESRPLRRLTRLVNVKSSNFHLTVQTLFEPTPRFIERYPTGKLEISKRGILPLLESYLSALVPALDRSTDVSSLLLCWGMSASARLGLEYVMHDVDLALAELDDPVEVLLGGDALDRKRLRASCANARDKIDFARSEKLRKLQRDWSEQVRVAWPSPLDVQRRLLGSLNAPTVNVTGLFPAAEAFCGVVDAYVDVIDSLAALDPQPSLLPDDSHDLPGLLSRDFVAMRRLRVRLQSLRTPDDSAPTLDLTRPDVLSEYLIDFAGLLKQFVSAFSWRFDPMPDRTEWLPRTRKSVIVNADFAKSTYRASTSAHPTYRAWANAGLNLIAQWGRAFGAREIPIASREGDDICLEFVDADSAVLCSCMIGEHFAALRATGNESVFYSVHWGLDQDLVSEGDGRNRLSSALSRASKLAKEVAVDEVGLTPDVANDCSPALQALLVKTGLLVELGENDERGRITPFVADRAKVIEAYIENLRAISSAS
jgi:adenine/guanine phosphoribosyltransferase-like PRPP-binding protein